MMNMVRKALFLYKKREGYQLVDFTGYVARAFEAAGISVTYCDPYTLLTPYGHDTYVRKQKPFPLSGVNLLTFYDIVVYNMDPFRIDARGCPCKTLFIYDEAWKGTHLPPGTDYMITAKSIVKYLSHANAWEYSQVKDVFTDIISFADYDIWKDGINVDKTIPLAYMGGIRSDGEWNPVLKSRYELKRKFVLWAQEHLDCWYQDPPQELEEFLETVPKVKVCIHISNEHSVGQGAWEALAAGSILLEYPRGKAAEEAGLIDGVNCFLFDTIEELEDQYRQIRWFGNDVQPIINNGRNLVLERHNFENFAAPFKKWIDKIIPVKTEFNDDLPTELTRGDYELNMKILKKRLAKTYRANVQKVFFNDEGSTSQTYGGK